MVELITVGYAILAAIVYAVFGYLKSTTQEGFEPTKFLSTIAIGAIIGVVFAFSGLQVTQEAVAIQLAAYAGLTAVIEDVVKSIWRRIFPEPTPPA